MSITSLCFVLIIVVSIAAFLLGRRVGGRPGLLALTVAGLAFVSLCIWSWLQWNPATLVRLVPLSVLSMVEGTAGTPLLAVILGVAWRRSRRGHERAAVVLGFLVGAVYFLRGGMWMVQPLPALAFADETGPRRPVVMQTQDFSCGPASCATALRRLGIWTTELEMADVTQARPVSGTTMIRTLHGLTRRLEQTPWRPRLIKADVDQLARLPMPALALTREQATQAHIVTLLQVAPRVVFVADPVDGLMMLSREQFEEIFTGEAMVFDRKPEGG